MMVMIVDIVAPNAIEAKARRAPVFVAALRFPVVWTRQPQLLENWVGRAGGDITNWVRLVEIGRKYGNWANDRMEFESEEDLPTHIIIIDIIVIPIIIINIIIIIPNLSSMRKFTVVLVATRTKLFKVLTEGGFVPGGIRF